MGLDVDANNRESTKVLSVKLCQAQTGLKQFEAAEVCRVRLIPAHSQC